MAKGKRKDKLGTVLEFGGKAKRNDSLRKPERLEENAEQLLPGLQNGIVLDNIVPKLPWRAFHILSSVSSYWRDAIQSHQVHDARARLNSLERLVVMNHTHPDGYTHALSLYSLREDSWHQLPDFPFYKRGIPPACCCAALEGSLYVLGGVSHDSDWVEGRLYRLGGWPHGDCRDETHDHNTGREAFVLDLVGQRGWKRCADLPKPVIAFACGVLDGKVYVLGGMSSYEQGGTCTNECWVYYPKKDYWSSIAPMSLKRCEHHVVTVGDELWVHGKERGYEAEDYPQIYHSSKDEWESVEEQYCYMSEQLVVLNEKPYLITPFHIYEREESLKGKVWTPRQVIHSVYGEDDNMLFRIVGAQAVDHELLVLFAVDDFGVPDIFLFRSKGFGAEQEKMYLDIVENTVHFDHQWCYNIPVMCAIDL